MNKTGVLKQYEKTFLCLSFLDLENGNAKIEIGREGNVKHPAEKRLAAFP
jgi:hypothetical protein